MRNKMQYIPYLLACLTPALAFFKVPCSNPLVVERADPIVQPGIAAGHVHTILGGSGFGFTMDYNQTQAARCSSCAPTADKSNYWIPSLYYQAENGGFTPVEQNGGALIYYLQRPDPHRDTILAPPEGLRMLAGSPLDRKFKDTHEADARSYVCLDYNGPAKPETNGFPEVNCPNGLRSQVFFPSCWDGVNLDSPDHKSHMAYPNQTFNNGPCPETHPVKIISIFIEVIWKTEDFADQWYGGHQPFVWSNGDPTGYGLHGDFFNGWDVSILQEAINTCDDPNGDITKCAALTLYPNSITEGCLLEPSIEEKIDGWLDALPGCNPVQSGPEDAKTVKDCGAPTEVGPPQHYYTDVTKELEWAWIGCTRDNVNFQRILSASSFSDDHMTVQKCIQTCKKGGYSIAGVEYARECYCGNSIAEDKMPSVTPMGRCLLPCSGDSSQNCGGLGYIGLYQACTEASCENLQYPIVPHTDAPPTAVPHTDAPTVIPHTDAPPTAVPHTDAPPTNAPPTAVPHTDAPTVVPHTDAPPTAVTHTDAPPTAVPHTDAPPTTVPYTDAPTVVPPTVVPPTVVPHGGGHHGGVHHGVVHHGFVPQWGSCTCTCV